MMSRGCGWTPVPVQPLRWLCQHPAPHGTRGTARLPTSPSHSPAPHGTVRSRDHACCQGRGCLHRGSSPPSQLTHGAGDSTGTWGALQRDPQGRALSGGNHPPPWVRGAPAPPPKPAPSSLYPVPQEGSDPTSSLTAPVRLFSLRCLGAPLGTGGQIWGKTRQEEARMGAWRHLAVPSVGAGARPHAAVPSRQDHGGDGDPRDPPAQRGSGSSRGSQDPSMVGVGRDLCGSPSPTPCPSRVTYSRL